MKNSKLRKYLDNAGIAFSTAVGMGAGLVTTGLMLDVGAPHSIGFMVIPTVTLCTALGTEFCVSKVVDNVVEWHKDKGEKEKFVTALKEAGKERGKYYVLELDNNSIDFVHVSYKNEDKNLEVEIYNKDRSLELRFWAENQVFRDDVNNKTYVIIEPKNSSSVELFTLGDDRKSVEINAKEIANKDIFMHGIMDFVQSFKEGVIPEAYVKDNSKEEQVISKEAILDKKEKKVKSISLKPSRLLKDREKVMDFNL